LVVVIISAGRPHELPAPFDGQRQYSHQVHTAPTTTNSLGGALTPCGSGKFIVRWLLDVLIRKCELCIQFDPWLCEQNWKHALLFARDSIHTKHAFAITIPSVRLSVTRMDQSKTVEVRIMQFSTYTSPIPVVFVR